MSLVKRPKNNTPPIKITNFRSSTPGLFLVKDVRKICSKFTGEHSCQSVISVKLLCNFIEITLQYGCSPVNLLHIFRTNFPKKICRGLRLKRLILDKVEPLDYVKRNN